MSCRRLFFPLMPLLLAGCAVGPDYERPETAVSDQWLSGLPAEPVDAQWWASFDDPALVSLVTRLEQGSPGLKESQARVAEARALRQAAQGGRLPQGGASGSATENRISENGQFPVANIPGFPIEFGLFDAGFDASWEVDLWGGTSRAIESARASEEAAQWAARDVRTGLVAELARSYLEFRAGERRVAIAQTEADAAGKMAELAGLLFAAGEADRTEAERATSVAARALAALSAAEATRDGARYRIATLVGLQPGEAIAELESGSGEVPKAPQVVAAGVRSELLERRPDVRRAERELAAATANVGVATSKLYPSFSLIGGIGLQARDAGDLTDGGSLRYSVGPTFSWPIFSMGRMRAQVRAADARADGAAARFEAAMLAALGETEDAANRFGAAGAQADAAERALERERAAYANAELRQERGEDSHLDLAQARMDLAAAENAEVQSRLAHAIAAIALYKALGGGWEDGASVATARQRVNPGLAAADPHAVLDGPARIEYDFNAGF